jgi:hypothetical protein
MINYCVRLTKGVSLYGQATSRLLYSLAVALAPLASNATADAPWAPSTEADIGKELPDGIFAAYLQGIDDAPTAIYRALVWVRAHVAFLLPLDPMKVNGDRSSFFIMLTPIWALKRAPHIYRVLRKCAISWFRTQPPWMKQYLPHAFAVLRYEWSQWQHHPADALASAEAFRSTFEQPLRLLATALGYRHPLAALVQPDPSSVAVTTKRADTVPHATVSSSLLTKYM